MSKGRRLKAIRYMTGKGRLLYDVLFWTYMQNQKTSFVRRLQDLYYTTGSKRRVLYNVLILVVYAKPKDTFYTTLYFGCMSKTKRRLS